MRVPLFSGWGLPLRIARRDARRARGRSILVLVMITLPVLGVTVADTIYTTQDLAGAEGIERRLGAAEARVTIEGRETSRVVQLADPETGSYFASGRSGKRLQIDGVLAVLGEPDAPVLAQRRASVRFVTEKGVGDAEVLETDLVDPLAAGQVVLSSGRLPAAAGEVVVNADLSARGPTVGEDLELADGSTLRIVGIAESTAFTGRPFAAGPVGSFGVTDRRTFLVGGAPVSWSQVRELNAVGVSVLSRAVLADPPPTSALPPAARQIVGEVDRALLTVLLLVVVMVLLEVVLLAGPAFAVGARRQAHTLALIAAAGGSPRDARRVVLSSGIVLGLLGAVLGVALGVGSAWLLMPVAQGFVVSSFGPFDVDGWHLLLVASFGLLSALLATAVPAWLAARQDVVAVLAGRRGDAAPSRRSPVLGLVLLGAGVALAAYGARGTGGETTIAAAAVVCVLGMLLLVPVVVTVLAHLARRLPLPVRFAARDAARHRTRTVPAVAAVAATVAGVVALGIAVSSDEAQSVAEYTPQAALGVGFVSLRDAASDPARVAQVREALARELPDATVTEVTGATLSSNGTYRDVRLGVPGEGQVLTGWSEGPGGEMIVADDASVPATVTGLVSTSDEQAERVRSALEAGGVVLLSDTGAAGDQARVVVREYPIGGGRPEVARLTLPATVVAVDGGEANTRAVLSPEAADAAGIRTGTTAFLVTGGIDDSDRRDAEEAVAALGPDLSLYVEQGYQAGDSVRIVQLVLGALGAVLMLGGTLTATFLALSDARPDLATLGAVGASPGTRRGVAAAYALVVGLVGSVLGALVGFVPGIAVSYPLTRPYDTGFGLSGPSHYLAVPWLLVVVVVVGLPLVTAALVWLTARARLPMVARLD